MNYWSQFSAGEIASMHGYEREDDHEDNDHDCCDEIEEKEPKLYWQDYL